jgi:hypothetical protein
VVWADKPIASQSSISGAVRNWWAAHAVGPTIKPQPGRQQTIRISVGNAPRVYAAIFSFDRNENMSDMSNVARAR